MIWNLPKRTIHYKGGFMMVSREDDPKYQCTSCYKLFWDEEVYISGFLSKIECPNCQSSLRTLTEEEPIITD
ncbi:Cold-shock protein [Vibrio crassostreae]|nr:Cold-shock protein [Vibrio crassostreae]CAK2431815.1 Cold-shock protein [Vibrio crassostreae]CAK2546586.1 Cold-shock protein [Vibrio crassostreae]CAK2977304.1 Cold-shock protein [Vibrio crassostreae]CAK3053101.1 Cold-shock protein [Vibrio crassostreae]